MRRSLFQAINFRARRFTTLGLLGLVTLIGTSLALFRQLPVTVQAMCWYLVLALLATSVVVIPVWLVPAFLFFLGARARRVMCVVKRK